MAAYLSYNTDARIISVTKVPVDGVTTLDVAKDIYSAIKKDWLENSTLNKFSFPFDPSGGETISTGLYTSPYYFLIGGWRMRPYEADHTLYLVNGYLGVLGGGEPWLHTLGNHMVNIRDVLPVDSLLRETGVSGLTAEESTMLTLLGATHGNKKVLDPATNTLKIYDTDGITLLYEFDVLDDTDTPNIYRPFKIIPK